MPNLGGITGLSHRSLLLPSATTYSGPTLAAIMGLTETWDAGKLGDILDSTGAVVSSQSTVAFSVRSGVAGGLPLICYDPSGTTSAGGTGWVWTPRCVGTEGGIQSRVNTVYPGLAIPPPTSTARQTIPGLSLGADVACSLWIVVSRANRAVYDMYTTPDATVPVLSFNGTVIVSVGNAADGTDQLVLFPGVGQVVLGAASSRYTMSLLLTWSAGGGVDVWLNDTKVATGVANQLPAAVTGTAIIGQAHHFHQGFRATRVLTAAELVTLLTSGTSISKRWGRGVRQNRLFPIMGQSNAEKDIMYGGMAVMQEALRFARGSLGADVCNFYTDRAPQRGASTQSSQSLYQSGDVPGTGGYLDNTAGGPPSGWALGGVGQRLMNLLNAPLLDERARMGGIVILYGESDCSRAYSEKATFKAAWQSVMQRVRAATGAPTLPFYPMVMFPYAGTLTAGSGLDMPHMMQREVWAELAADPTQYVVPIVANMADVDYETPSDPTTGTHSNGISYARIGVRAALTLANKLPNDAGDALLPGLPASGGPTIVSAVRESSTSILVTVQHDGGNDLRLAAQPTAGWAVYDGYVDPTNRGTLRVVSAVARASATQLRITLATGITGAARLFPTYGVTRTLVAGMTTDNFSATVAGLAVSSSLGSSYAQDYPIQNTAFGIGIT